ncbi:hypothetical protein [Kitasatospora indigofera]
MGPFGLAGAPGTRPRDPAAATLALAHFFNLAPPALRHDRNP